ncbi:hypothetical protein LEP1GSC193_3662 [Leptospira alstonii serovar Pingchang str. 80-412]|uniref:Uncharacterized protein n=2 Tax=Leptospira alstonii TaxID=28452 RepID=M6D230_9LEPT|nr:hypothetical protein LEP1GSC194_3408 [Leptospira alstonii serovar Sichuan str. 79601]EQA81291.1 hypothetical protein LEP1GSC193_3662 [Leptospira alstonii serovar Pingchang str. 80-412]
MREKVLEKYNGENNLIHPEPRLNRIANDLFSIVKLDLK